jgi:hypothetical protein
LGLQVQQCETVKVDHVGDNMNDSESHDRPCGGFVESDVLVEGNDTIEGGLAKERDEVAANGKENEDDIDIKNEGGGTSNG